MGRPLVISGEMVTEISRTLQRQIMESAQSDLESYCDEMTKAVQLEQ
jgi:hypothetical protein